MKFGNLKHRWLAALLAVALVITLLPVGAISVRAETVKGAEQTVDLTADAFNARENNINKGWKFYLGTSSTAQNQNFDDSGWTDVDLPHDFSITQSFTTSGEAESGFLPGGTGWYRKSFTMPEDAAGKTVLLNFDGVYMNATVYVNGTELGTHNYGYTSFAFDITDYLVCDGATENLIAVKAVNNVPTSRWYSGSGIYRDVELLVLDPVHVDLNGVAVTTPNISSGSGNVNVTTKIINDNTTDVTVEITSTVYPKGSTTAVASASNMLGVDAGMSSEIITTAVVENPALWSIESPNLYTLVTEISVDGEVVDTCETEFGFRWFTFSSTGFALNGENVKLNGVCLHHDQGALGSAAYYDAMYRQLSIMKDMGANAIRTSHNPADEEFIAICSELGLLVIEETFDGLVDAKNGNSNDFSVYFESEADDGLYGYESGMTCAEYAARSNVRRDRNAPCVFAWSFGNEIQEGTYWQNVSRYDEICADYITWVNAEDGTRIVTSGDNNRGGSADLVNVINTITGAGGVAGFNYANDISTLSSLASSYGGSYGCIIASETASHTNSRGIYVSQASNSSVDGKMHLTSYDTSSVGWGITAHDSIYNTYSLDNVAGEFVWTGFDYIGEPTPWNGTGSGSASGSGAVPNSSYFGIVETTGFAKDSYWLYRAQWNKDATTVHLVTAWDSDNYMLSNNQVPVWVYSNAPKVELYLNDTLIGTTTRTAVTSDAGHTYYTYSSTSNSDVCSVTNGSGADALYAVFNVTYTAGTLTAKAYDESGNEIALDDSCGQYTVTTPGTVTQLNATANKTRIAADGSSLVYIEVDVLDADGNLDTTAANNITFTLEGPGEILGVDNGDQATVDKFQQASVLTSSKSANIDAYAGKALVIVTSTEEAGEIRVSVASDGLTGETVTINAVTTGEEEAATGLVSYTMVRDYSVKAGTAPELDTTATGTQADGSTLTGTIVWNEVTADVYGTAGDYTITGVLTFEGYDPINVNAKLHVIPNVIAMRNIATATTAGVVPSLPNVVNGVLADGTVTGEFTVTWETVDASALANVGDIVTVNGTATVMGDETLSVTCTIRVAQEVQTESTNIAPQADGLYQDVPEAYWSDSLSSVINGTTNAGDNTSERWSNWRYRTTSATATLTLTWATAHKLSSIDLHYYYDFCCAYPEEIVFKYSLNGEDYTEIGYTAELVENYSLGAHYAYTLDEVVDPVAIQIVLTQQSGTSGDHCVGLMEIEVYTYAASLEYNSSADLSGITVDGTAIEGFAADTLAYEADGTAVAATTDANAGITILPAYDGMVRILTIAEDGSETKTYAVTVGTPCAHENTEVRDAAEAACTTDGYTGDIWCTDCDTLVTEGTVIPAAGHSYVDGTCTACGDVLVHMAQNTATETNYTTLEEALDAAAAGDTVRLLTDVTEGYVLVAPGVTLDLNGHALTASYAVGFDTAHIVDNAGGGKLVTGAQNVVLDEENAMIPVYDGVGYVFTKAGFAIRQDSAYEGEGIKINAMAYPVLMDVVELLKDGSEDNSLEIMIRLSWDTDEGTGSQEFKFTDAVVAEVYSSNGGAWNRYEKMFSMIVTGFGNIENLRANIMVVSGTNVQYVSSTSVSIT
ncbi:MAG: DUF4982 domain-containing protein [Oscillospiraceae bacterium]|nr:DUF4982 domain-containing protein [Oscillospiraceae bacterium]